MEIFECKDFNADKKEKRVFDFQTKPGQWKWKLLKGIFRKYKQKQTRSV